ncbi:MAG: hypothetical protein LUE93_01680 [Bacteroides sp.]|nr:hypothetical protein [Bacteroides sp.]
MNSNKLHLGSYKDGGVSALSVSNERGVLIESANKGAQYENVANIEIYAKDNGNIILNTTTGKAIYKDNELATVDDLPDTSDFVDLTNNQTLSNTKNLFFGGSTYSRLSASGGVLSRACVVSLDGKTSPSDGRSGVAIGSGIEGVGNDAYVSITAGDSQPSRIVFYQKGGTTSSSVIQESYPGILSIPKSLVVGGTQSAPLSDSQSFYVTSKTTLNGDLNITGNTFLNKNILYLDPDTINSYIETTNDNGVRIVSTNEVGIKLVADSYNSNIDLNTRMGVARYNGKEIATTDETSALRNEIAELKQQIAELKANL